MAALASCCRVSPCHQQRQHCSCVRGLVALELCKEPCCQSLWVLMRGWQSCSRLQMQGWRHLPSAQARLPTHEQLPQICLLLQAQSSSSAATASCLPFDVCSGLWYCSCARETLLSAAEGAHEWVAVLQQAAGAALAASASCSSTATHP